MGGLLRPPECPCPPHFIAPSIGALQGEIDGLVLVLFSFFKGGGKECFLFSQLAKHDIRPPGLENNLQCERLDRTTAWGILSRNGEAQAVSPSKICGNRQKRAAVRLVSCPNGAARPLRSLFNWFIILQRNPSLCLSVPY